ncbi:hypothetical protein AD006_29215 (plasmid) [Pseudonocardia sp. EC080610-09]|nr:hypothetical protein AD006_29215 [Pseudonocardia sp. EC080610-09]ALL85338.1 hypothetical protein AD017_29605 [Pseudonocardia sp. EC080619-01]
MADALDERLVVRAAVRTAVPSPGARSHGLERDRIIPGKSRSASSSTAPVWPEAISECLVRRQGIRERPQRVRPGSGGIHH